MTSFDSGRCLPTPLLALDLSDEHAAVLRASAIDFVRVQERQYRTVPAGTAVIGPVGAELTRMGFNPFHVSHACATGALVIPTFDVYGYVVTAQLRFDSPIVGANGKATKCIGPAAPVPVRLDFGPTPTDAADPLWITEGVKKADALASLGLRALAMPGVDNWKGANDGSAINADLDALPKGMTVRVVFDADAAEKPGVAGAQEKLARWLRTAKDATVSVAVLPGAVGDHECKGVDDHLAAGFTLSELEACLTSDVPKYVDVKAQEKAVKAIKASVDGTNPEDVVTDARMGVMVATELFPGRFRWVNGAGWAHWDGSRWEIDGKNDKPVQDAVRLHLEDWYKTKVKASAESGAARSREGLRELQIYRSVMSRTKRDAVIKDASAVEGVLCDLRDFDTDPNVLNTPSGLLDLRTGTVAPRTSDALVTKVTGVDHVAGATSPLWDAALMAIPADIRGWMQLRLGEALSGNITADAGVMFWLGGGGNGKSTLLEAIMATLGDYAGTVSPKVVAGGPNEHPTEIMSLRGLRVAVVEELPEGKILNVATLKRISGVSRVTARYTYQDNVEIKLSHALIVASNYDPIVTETDDGAWRRLIRVPFPYKFVNRPEHDNEREGDASLMSRLRGDKDALRAALAWMVEGAVRYHREYAAEGLHVPHAPSVAAACDAWRRAADPTYTFAEDYVVWDPSGVVTSADMLSAYNAFLATQGMNKVSARTLKDRVSATAARAGQSRTVAGPVLKWVSDADVSRPPAHLVDVPSSGRSTSGDGFTGSPDAVSRTAVRVYTGLRFRTDQDDAAAEAAELVEAAELITATAAASGTTDDRDQDDEAGVGMTRSTTCAEDGCTAFGYRGHDRCSDHVPWCTYEDTKCFDVSAAYPAPGPCGYHDQDDEVECAIEDCDDDVYVPSVSPLCREHLREAAADAYGEDFGAYLRDSTPLVTAASHAFELGGDVVATRTALARWWADAAARRAA